VQQFLAAHALPVDVAGFGVAGPVRNGRSEAVNLAWAVDARELARALPRSAASVLNDLEAHAYGISLLAPEDVVALNPGAADAAGNAAVIAAGTGLGEAGLHWDGRRHRPFAGEGAHASFAPTDAVQGELLSFLRRDFGHVTWERVLSGPGLHNTYRILRDTGRDEEPDWLTREMRQGNPAAVISQAALAGTSALCRQALDLFVALYGAEAGKLALKLMATGGVYMGGGIAPKIIRTLTEPTFMAAFVAKGRLTPVLEAIPVRVIMHEQVALPRGSPRSRPHDGERDPHMVTFAPSILAADFWRLGEQVKAAEAAGADRFHIDVMGGRFLPNLSLGLPIVEAMWRGTALPLELHLMIQAPERDV
jgi:glucokinase